MSAFKPSKILIFGGTGAIGEYLTRSLIRAKPAVGQLFLFTSQNTAQTKAPLLEEWKKQGLQAVIGDVTSASDVAAAYKSSGADTVVSALGRGAIDKQIDLVRLAEESNTVQWFFPSEYGTDIEYGPKSPNEKPHQLKLQVRKYIRENVQRLKITYLVTGPYFDMWVNSAPGSIIGRFDHVNKEAVIVQDSQKIGFCTMWDVGKFLVAALRHPEQSFGKALKVQSFIVSPQEVLAEYEKQTGASWKVQNVTLDELRQGEVEAWERKDPYMVGYTLRRIWAEGYTLYEKNDNEAIGVKPGDEESLETAVRRAISGSKE